MLNGYKKPFLISVEIDIVENSSLYTYLVFFNVLTSTINTHFYHIIEILNQIALGGLTILFAILSDKIRREKVMKFVFITFVILSYPVFLMVLSGDNLLTIMAHILFIIPIAASLGPVSALMCELFTTKFRYNRFGLSRNMAAGFFGGLAPFIRTTIMKITGQETSANFYVIFCALVGLVAILQVKEKTFKILA